MLRLFSQKPVLSKFRFCVSFKFTNEHEWVKYDQKKKLAKVGITNYAQKELGDIVHIDFPKIGLKFQQTNPVGAIESVKVAADIYAPISGEIVNINDDVKSQPQLVNEDAENNWIFESHVTKPEELEHLMTKQQYEEFVKGIAPH